MGIRHKQSKLALIKATAFLGWLQHRWARLFILVAIGLSLLLLIRSGPVDAQSGNSSNRPRSPLSPLSPLTTTVGITAVNGITDPLLAGALVTTTATLPNQAPLSATTNLSATTAATLATLIETASITASVDPETPCRTGF